MTRVLINLKFALSLSIDSCWKKKRKESPIIINTRGLVKYHREEEKRACLILIFYFTINRLLSIFTHREGEELTLIYFFH